MFYALIAILSGISNVISRSVNFVLSEKLGVYQSTLFNYIFGLAGSILILFISGEASKLFASTSYDANWLAYTGGLVGVAVVSLQVFLSSKVSSFYLTLLLFVGQLFTGIILDFILSGKISIWQVVGGILVIVGLSYNLYVDRVEEIEVASH
ncbi:DMT family transporter [Paraclostridium bifermentans]|uniref:DMT family transporter n=1 Tax=Paraclostridium bifermentans TaxID=1490 RepID=UPI001C7E3BF9|nr:DMT family transporter [Paraclostridium bifermentans]GIM32806.1 membrane protein [Paraclostridium bifermentans subsp. muricolitidis]